DPRLVVVGKIDLVGERAAPQAHHLLGRFDPEVPRETIGNTAHRHAIVVDGLDRLLDNTLRVDRPRPEERGLRAEHAGADRTHMHAYNHGQHDGLFEVDIDSHAGCAPQAPREAATTLALRRRKAPTDPPKRARRRA